MSQAAKQELKSGSRVRWEGYVDLSSGNPQQIRPIKASVGTNISKTPIIKPRSSRKNILFAFLFGMFSAVIVLCFIAALGGTQSEDLISYKDLGVTFQNQVEEVAKVESDKSPIQENLHVTVRNGKKEFSPELKKQLIARIATDEAKAKPLKKNDPSVTGAANKVYSIIKNYIPHPNEGMKLAYAIVQESKLAKYDPLFVAAVIKSESAFNRFATSPVGAKGLMQIMPQTGKYVANTFEEFQDVPTGYLTDVGYNLKLGIAYLKYLEEMFQGNRVLTLIAYNWGPGKVDNTLQGKNRGVPREVMNYALKILSDHQKWQREVALEDSKLLA